MSHERTITLQHKGRWYNIPGVSHRSGKKISQRSAKRRALATGLIKGRGFASVTAAEKAAKKRSKTFDTPENIRFASSRPGGRVRRRHKLAGTRTPFNPGGGSRPVSTRATKKRASRKSTAKKR